MHSSLKGIIIIFLCSKIFTFILDITSHPNIFSVFHYEIKKIVPICVAKSFQIETSDLKSLIPPAVFDPITSNPNQFSFNIKLKISRSQFKPLFLDTIKPKSNVQLVLFSKESLARAPIKQMRFSKFLPVLKLLCFLHFAGS